MKCDICIIGAGASGLTAAIFAAQAGAKVMVAEAGATAARKLLRTGRGRCNLTHTGSVNDFVKVYGACGRFLKHSLHEFSPEDVREFLAGYRLKTKVEKNGCVFPITDRAADVKRVLDDNVRRLGVKFFYGKKIQTVKKSAEGFLVEAPGTRIVSSAVIIATGGLSWPHTGSTGNGYEFAKSFSHTIVQPKPALVSLITSEAWPIELQGVGVKDVVLKAKVNDKKITSHGPMMFTDDGIGGPAVFDMSRLITDYLFKSSKPVKITIDMLPGMGIKELDELLIERCKISGRKELGSIFTGIFSRSLALNICRRLEPSKILMANQLGKDQRRKLIKIIKSSVLTAVSTRPISEATITKGGVLTSQINSKTMESKLCDGLFFAGEVLDADGPCGGYNLQIAWSTGALAGKCAALSCGYK
jgi:predicted Rossmann fold flavoprotein